MLLCALLSTTLALSPGQVPTARLLPSELPMAAEQPQPQGFGVGKAFKAGVLSSLGMLFALQMELVLLDAPLTGLLALNPDVLHAITPPLSAVGTVFLAAAGAVVIRDYLSTRERKVNL